ncbi:MAG: cation diffusion facilitator family transporter [Promethearchaeota archaeon]
MTNRNENLKIYENPIFLNFFLFSITLLLFILKLIFSYITNSLALQADAFDNLTDLVMIFAALIGIMYSRKKPNENFPYGYYKVENIVSLFISIFIFYTSYTIISQSIRDFINFISGNFKTIETSIVIYFFLVISLIITLSLTFYLKILGKKSNSPVIESEASEKLYDNFISLSVLIGFIGASFNLFLLDSIIGFFIALFIIKGGYDIFLNSTKVLLDAVIDFDKRTELNNLIEAFPKIKKIEKLEIRSYGKYVFLEVNVNLNKDLTLNQAQTLKRLINNKIRESFPQIFKVLILTQTAENPTVKFAVPLLDNNGLNSHISDHFGESPFFALFEIEESGIEIQLLNYNIVANKFIKEEKRKGILISDWLISYKIDKILLKNDLKIGPKLMFEKALISIEIIDLDNLNEIINYELTLSKSQ